MANQDDIETIGFVQKGTQTDVLLMGCEPEQILSQKGATFSDLRVTRKWFDKVSVGESLPVYTSVKPDDYKPSEDNYPDLGQYVCTVTVMGKDLYDTWEMALLNSYNNHAVLSGMSEEEFTQMIGEVYPGTALMRADGDGDGYTVLTLVVNEEPMTHKEQMDLSSSTI